MRRLIFAALLVATGIALMPGPVGAWPDDPPKCEHEERECEPPTTTSSTTTSSTSTTTTTLPPPPPPPPTVPPRPVDPCEKSHSCDAVEPVPTLPDTGTGAETTFAYGLSALLGGGYLVWLKRRLS